MKNKKTNNDRNAGAPKKYGCEAVQRSIRIPEYLDQRLKLEKQRNDLNASELITRLLSEFFNLPENP